MEQKDLLVLEKAREFSKRTGLKIISMNDLKDSMSHAFFALASDGSGVALGIDWMESLIEGNGNAEGAVRFLKTTGSGDININFSVDKNSIADQEVVTLMAEIVANIKAVHGVDDSLIVRESALSQI